MYVQPFEFTEGVQTSESDDAFVLFHHVTLWLCEPIPGFAIRNRRRPKIEVIGV